MPTNCVKLVYKSVEKCAKNPCKKNVNNFNLNAFIQLFNQNSQLLNGFSQVFSTLKNSFSYLLNSSFALFTQTSTITTNIIKGF